MKEQEWDIPKIADSLHAETELAQSPAEGPGVRFLVGLSQTTLEVWPQTGHVKITSPDFEIHGYRLKPCAVEEGSVSFSGGVEGAYSHLWVEPSGNVLLQLAGQTDARQLTPERLTPPPAPEAPPPPEQLVEEPQGSERAYVTLMGRVGRAPVFWTTRNGVPVTKFPLGVHLEDDSTQWHTVKAWRKLAEKARELKKGQLAQVRGYASEETSTRKGVDRVEKVIRAAAIIPK